MLTKLQAQTKLTQIRDDFGWSGVIAGGVLDGRVAEKQASSLRSARKRLLVTAYGGTAYLVVQNIDPSMLHVFTIPLLTVAVVLGIVLVCALIIRGRKERPDERLNHRFDYRKEPHADQTTEQPNKLSDNEITRG
jgi:hypothetical protein